MRARTFATLFLAAAGLLVCAAWTGPALAGTYTVRSCSTPTSGLKGLDDAWQRVTGGSTAAVQFAKLCPPSAPDSLGGLLVRDKDTPGGAGAGAFAEYRFDAPPGTTLTSVALRRQIGKRSNAWTLYTQVDGLDRLPPPETDCSIPTGAVVCQFGGQNVDSTWSVPGARSFSIGIRCATAPCPTGIGLPQAWTAIYGAEVTVDDPTPPDVAAENLGGRLLTDRYVRGSAAATISSATDGSGIQRLELSLDGALVAQKLRPCDVTRRAPCTNITAAESMTVDTSTLTEAPHLIELRVFDGGGNITPVTRTVTVDNSAPLAPTPTSPTTATATAPTADIAWTDPDAQLAPITAAHLTVCGPAGCEQRTQSQSGAATVGLTQGAGRYDVSVSLEDAAGNRDPANRAVWTVDYVPPPAPPAAVAPLPGQQVLGGGPQAPRRLVSPRLLLARPAVERDRRTIAVHGSVAPGVTGAVTVTASARIRGRTRTITARAAIARRRYTARLRLPSVRWRTATVRVRYSGSATRTSAEARRTVRQRARPDRARRSSRRAAGDNRAGRPAGHRGRAP